MLGLAGTCWGWPDAAASTLAVLVGAMGRLPEPASQREALRPPPPARYADPPPRVYLPEAVWMTTSPTMGMRALYGVLLGTQFAPLGGRRAGGSSGQCSTKYTEYSLESWYMTGSL